MKNFTDRFIQSLKTEKDFELFRSTDTGFAIEVAKSGRKKWVFVYKYQGRKRKMPLGRYPDTSLADARQKWRDARNLFERGIDPQETTAPESVKSADTKIFSTLISDYLENYSSRHHAQRWHYNIRKAVDADIKPQLGSLAVKEIRRGDIISLIEAVAQRAPGQSRTVLKVIRQIFDYAVLREIVDSNPCTLVTKAVPATRPLSRDRVLSDDELKMIWREIDNGPGSLEIKAALKLVLITAQRPEEVIEMRWEDLDLASGWWNMPQRKQKKNSDGERPIHRVYLTDLARELIPRVNHGYVFKSPDSSETDLPMKRNSISQLVVRKIYQGPKGNKKIIKEPYYGLSRWTPHDLRRTARTIMSRIGIDSEHAERVLGHKLRGIQAVYDRYVYDKEKKAALIAWESELRRIVDVTHGCDDY